MKKLISTNPAKDYKAIGEVAISSDKEIKRKVESANKAKLMWKELGIKKRIELLKPIFNEFVKRKKEISRLETQEVGKPIKESAPDVEDYLDQFKWYMDNAESALKEEITFKDNKSVHKIIYEPSGVVAVITPWNFPFGMFIWGVIPNLLVGNTVVYKISEECPLVGKLIEEVMSLKNIPEGVFSEVYGAGDVGQKLAESDINLIWFTGSTKTGQNLYKIAADKFIKVVFELGGSNPGIVFDDVNVNNIIDRLHSKRYSNCGQTCNALKRLIVHEKVFDEVVNKLKQKVESRTLGDPENPNTEIGSLVAKRQLDLLEAQVKDAVKKGAKIITGGSRPKNLKGAFFAPTILTNITKDMRVWKEEVFGPVLPVISFKDEDEAIALGNDTKYGLGGMVFSDNKERARRVASKIQAGSMELNGANRWQTRFNPFGGYKYSGMGREFGKIGFQELCQIKVISEKQ